MPLFGTVFSAVLGAALGLFLAGVLALAIYAGWFLVDRALVGMSTETEEEPKK